MTLISAVIVPNMQMVRRQEANKVANELGLDMNLLRMKALTTGNPYTLTLNADGKEGYSIQPTLVSGSTQRSGNKDNTQRIQIKIHIGEDIASSTTTKLKFESGKLIDDNNADAATNEITRKILIEVLCENNKALLYYEPVTGYYTIQME